MISWMKGTLGISRNVATELYRGQLLKSWKEFSDIRDDNIDQVIAAIQRDLKDSIAKIAVIRLKLVIYRIYRGLSTS